MISIKDERIRQSMTQKRLAFEAGIDARTLRKIEKGEVVSPESTRAVMSVLGLTISPVSANVNTGIASTIHKKINQSIAVTFLSVLAACFVGNAFAIVYAPAVALFVTAFGIASIALAIVAWDIAGRPSSDGKLAGAAVFCFAAAWAVGLHVSGLRFDFNTGYEFSKSAMIIGALLAVSPLRRKLIRKADTGVNLTRLLLAIGLSWLGALVYDGLDWSLLLWRILSSAWKNPDYQWDQLTNLIVPLVFPMLLVASLVMVSLKRTKTSGLLFMLAICTFYAGFWAAKDISEMSLMWEVNHKVYRRSLLPLISTLPQIAMALISIYELRGHFRKVWSILRTTAIQRGLPSP